MLLKMVAIGLLGLLMIGLPAVAAQSCKYMGVDYNAGEKIEGVCLDMTCVAGKWNTTGTFDGDCGLCTLDDNLHVMTSDGYRYDWAGTCNYSVSQMGFGFRESSGIYSQFKPCGSAACMDVTTFIDSPSTVFEISHLTHTKVKVNGVLVTLNTAVQGLGGSSQPVLAWLDGCSMFLGSQGFLLRACPNQLFVWTSPILQWSVYGLCGTFTKNQDDDFIDRVGALEPLSPFPFRFPDSWQTAEQSKKECKRGDVCKGGDDSRKKKYEICKTLLSKVQWQNTSPSNTTLNQAILDCTTDLCVLDEKKAKAAEIEAWKKTMQTMLQTDIMIGAKTTAPDVLAETGNTTLFVEFTAT